MSRHIKSQRVVSYRALLYRTYTVLHPYLYLEYLFIHTPMARYAERGLGHASLFFQAPAACVQNDEFPLASLYTLISLCCKQRAAYAQVDREQLPR